VLVLLPSLAVLVCYAAYTRIYVHQWWWVNILLTLAVFGLHISEILWLSPGNLFPLLDEGYFLRQSQASTTEVLRDGIGRYNLYILFAHVAQIATPEWILKIINIPWLWIMIIQLYRLGGSSPWVLRLFPIALPYLYFLGTMNMRDTLGLVVLIATIGMFVGRIRFIETLPWRVMVLGVSVVTLGSIRPQWLVFLGVALLCYALVVGNWRMKAVVLIAAAGVVVLLGPLFSRQVAQLQTVAQYSVEARAPEWSPLDGRGGFGVQTAFTGIVRQLITPLPSSKVVALVTQPAGPKLYLPEISRIIMNLWFLGALIYGLVHPKKVLKYLRANPVVLLLAIFAAVNTVVYGLYFFGVGSSRNKVLPIIVAMLFVSSVLDRREHPVRSSPSDARRVG